LLIVPSKHEHFSSQLSYSGCADVLQASARIQQDGGGRFCCCAQCMDQLRETKAEPDHVAIGRRSGRVYAAKLYDVVLRLTAIGGHYMNRAI
jgi:hypothetical protein